MKSYHKEVIKYLAILLGSFAVLWIGFFFLARDIRGQAEIVEDDRILIAQNSRLVETLASLKKISPRVKGYEQKLSTLIPTQDNIIDFQRWMEDQGRTAGVGLTFSFEGTVAPPTLETPGYYPFSIRAQGNYLPMLNFLRELEISTTKFLISIEAFDLNHNQENYSFYGEGRVFFR